MVGGPNRRTFLKILGTGATAGSITSIEIPDRDELTLSVQGGESYPGETATVDFTLTNIGSETQYNPEIRLGPPLSDWRVKPITDDEGQRLHQDDDEVFAGWQWDTLDVGESVQPSVKLYVPDTANPGEYVLRPTALNQNWKALQETTETESAPTPTPTTTTEEPTSTAPEPEADSNQSDIQLSATGDSTAPGGTVQVDFEVHNSDTEVRSVTVTLEVPEGWEIIEHFDDGGSWQPRGGWGMVPMDGWEWEIDPETTKQPWIRLEVPESVGEEAYTIPVKRISGDVVFESISTTVTVTQETTIQGDESTITVKSPDNDSQNSESDGTSQEVLFETGFEDYTTEAYPNDWVRAGNQNQAVVDSTAGSGSKSFHMSGDPGGCWEAISHHPLKIPKNGAVRITGKVRPTSEGSAGCHEEKRGTILLRTEAIQDTYPGDGIRLFELGLDGVIRGVENYGYGLYQTDVWQDFTFEYARSDGTVTHRLWWNGNKRGSATREVTDFEDELSALSLQSGDFSIYWDDFSITKGSTPAEDSEGGSSLSGVITTPFNDPIEGLELKLFDRSIHANSDNNPLSTATTDTNGRYRFTPSSIPEHVVITAVHPQQSLFDSYPLNSLNGEFNPVVHNQHLFGPEVTSTGNAVVSAWRHVDEDKPEYQSFRIEIFTANQGGGYITNCGFGISLPESIDVKYNSGMLSDHPLTINGITVFAHSPDPNQSSNPLARFPPNVTGVPAFSSVSTISNAYQSQSSEELQRRNTLQDASQDILNALPVFGTILDIQSAIEEYWVGEDETHVAGTRPEEPPNPNTMDSVTEVFSGAADAVVIDIPVRVTETTDQVQFESRWNQSSQRTQKVFGHQQELEFMNF